MSSDNSDTANSQVFSCRLEPKLLRARFLLASLWDTLVTFLKLGLTPLAWRHFLAWLYKRLGPPIDKTKLDEVRTG